MFFGKEEKKGNLRGKQRCSPVSARKEGRVSPPCVNSLILALPIGVWPRVNSMQVLAIPGLLRVLKGFSPPRGWGGSPK